MVKHIHEIRDPIHVFVRLDDHERNVLNSNPFQRLRHIHQLALTYLLYPGATHRRFEHSLGVMELAGRVYDVITNPENVSDDLKEHLPEIDREDDRRYWRRVLRMAALCHDMGHLPFSHGAEIDLLPEGIRHEDLTEQFILSDEMKSIWETVTPPLRPHDVVKLAIGPKKAKNLKFTDWEAILSEIIIGDAFGVDRMDYLLRDSHHTGVAYGRFDHFRLIDTLRILKSPPAGTDGTSHEPALGVEEGGLHSAEALMLARYFMFSQMYFHPVRRIYDIHLKDFLKERLPGGMFSTDVRDQLLLTDNEITVDLLRIANQKSEPGYIHAYRIIYRKHFKILYQRNPSDILVNRESGEAIYRGASKKFGIESFRHDRYTEKGGAPEFPVLMGDERIESSLATSQALQTLPVVSVDFVFSNRDILGEASDWLQRNRSEIISSAVEKEED